MLSVSPSGRSSLEEMLDSLRRRDEDRQKDLPPALPARPTSRARLPKRPLPAKFDTGDVLSPELSSSRRNDLSVVSGGGGNFGRKKVKDWAASGESPYTLAAMYKRRLTEKGGASPATSPPPSPEAEWDDSISYFIKMKLRVWCQLRNGQWELGKIQSSTGEKASVVLLDGTVMTVSTEELLPANSEILDGVDNLVELGFLNEPSVLRNLQYRYARDVIYSMAGPVLLAINPFKDVQIYGSDLITAYKEKILDNPHVYAIADTAYNDMMRDGVNQSIIISGESGAGKSVTAKYAMEYLVAIGDSNCEISCKILQTSSILEAFGNAKTSRSSNSTRYGKLIEIQYNEKGTICGAHVQTLLLEKSRVSQLCRGERSYHIFYQICAGAPSDLKDRLNLKMASEYKFLNQSGCLKINDVDDAQNFKKLMEALDTLRISHENQELVFKLVAAVLWLGNISFEVIDDDNHVEIVVDEASRSAARLMGCKVEDLMVALSTHKRQPGETDMAQKLTLQQAIDTRDALGKFVYASLFSWLVEEINRSLEGGTQHTGRSISILDIYGFESFQKNRFEQFCINYANERLQQHFIRHLVKREQEEYELEGVNWRKLEFKDNQVCLDLFEKTPTGLISILDEDSNSCETTDLTFANKLKQLLSSNPCFNGERGAFKVRHYAGEVQYETTGFLEKNRDTLQSNTIQLLSLCHKQLPRLFASSMLNQAQENESAASNLDKQGVGTKFKGQLFKLIQQLENSKPHFILCIRPNCKQLPGMYEKDLVLEQLRSNGVVEIVHISRSRYPTRLKHQEFASRFGCLLSENILCADPLSTSVAILQQYHFLPEMYQVGYTKLFFRNGQVDILENMRQQVLEGTREVENGFLGGRVLLDFHELKFGIVTLQAFVRGENARKEYDVLKKLSHQIAPRSLDDHLMAVVRLQSVIRGWLARRYFDHLRNWKKPTLDSSKSRRRSRSRSRISEVKGLSQENIRILPSNIEELQRRVIMTESTLSQREHENMALREQVRQFEARWSEYESKMKSVEETWQRQMTSLQKSLAAAKKTLGADNSDGLHGKSDGSPSPLSYDSEDNISSQTPPRSAPVKSGNNGREINGVSNTVDHLSKEFEQRKQNFDDHAKAVTDVKTGQVPSSKQIEDFKKLKQKFEAWKKEYKHRLRETKVKLLKGVHTEGGGDRRARHWWGKLSKKY